MLQNVLKTALHNNSSFPIHSVNQSRIANSDTKFTLVNVNTQQDPMYQILKYFDFPFNVKLQWRQRCASYLSGKSNT